MTFFFFFCWYWPQWLYFDTRSTPQQRSCLHWKWERCPLLVWSSPPSCYISRTSGLLISLYLLQKLHHLFFYMSIHKTDNHLHGNTLPLIYSTGEENDKRHPPVSSSTAEVYSHDGSSGSCNHFSGFLFLFPDLLFLNGEIYTLLVYNRAFREETKSYSTSFLLSMLRNYSQLYILQPSVKLARNMEASLQIPRVYS